MSANAYPLHEACQNGEKDKAKSLIRKKWDVNEFDERHWTPLHCAANARQLDVCKYLLSKGANPSFTTSNNATALHYLARMKDHALLQSVLKSFIDKGADVNHPNTYGNTPLHEASLRGSVNCMQFLLANGAKVDVQNSYGETPLHQAIRGGCWEAIELLIRKGAKPDLIGRDGSAIAQAKIVLNGDTYSKFEKLIGRMNFGIDSDSICSYNTLPAAVAEMANQAKIKPQTIDQNFELFAGIIRFITKNKLLPNVIDHDKVTFETDDPRNVYKIESSSSGSGGFGTVFVGKHNKTKKLVAIKKTSNKTTKDFKNNTNELRLLKRCQHKNVVQFLEAYNLINEHEIWSVMEYMEGGSLQALLKKQTLKEKQMAYIVKHILEGLNCLHSKFVIHRDIKSHNIMLTVQGDIKIVDFGLAMDLRTGSAQKVAGSPLWMAPEVIRREPQSFPVDIWSLGITILELVNGEPPNANNQLKAMYSTALGETKPVVKRSGNYSSDFLHFLEECLKPDPNARPTTEMLLKHRWLEQVCTRDEMQEIILKTFVKQGLTQLGF